MVHLYVLNPTQKLRFVSRLILKGSKRILKQVNKQDTSSRASSSSSSSVTDVEAKRRQKISIYDLIKDDLPSVPEGGLTRNAKYYMDESEGGFCVFRVENTLFKVHKCYLLREPSAFGDMFSLPNIPGIREGTSDEVAIPLWDTAQQFEDLLWVLYAIPSQLFSCNEADEPSLERLLNIAEMTNKYCIASYESWSLQKLYMLAQNPAGFLRTSPASACARALDIAALCNDQKLLDMICHRLIPRILWSDVEREPFLKVAETRGLRKLQGVLYYKELIEMDRASASSNKQTSPNRLIFPPDMNVRKRMCFFSAHYSLCGLWECVAMDAPTFIDHGCPSHAECLSAWSAMWTEAACAHQTMRHSSVDVLGRLKAMMLILKKTVRESESMTLGCTLAALESITLTRDDIIAGLMDHFQDF
ncbi:hypothetical protein JR316_0007288 [Psilocybe cubensis]|uniref:BTB domain-containing protein n=2 Tax=Psilocybe cubensis TaxID=181762 RepID=A0A8H7XP51_PSICU|nr:hypothetical protein JR316_0007288 [Psilocybe cubensis]KAH9480688.1 hypothetical protein JR316_0007288 [Psilocybe cubensis]